MADPVQIRDPDGRVLTVQRSSLPMYLRRGCEEVTEAEQAVEAEVERLAEDYRLPPTSAPKPSWVAFAESQGWDDAAAETKSHLIEVLTSPPADPPATGTDPDNEE